MRGFDVPKYKVRPRTKRFLFNRWLIMIGLGILVYIMTFVNYYLINETVPVYINWLLTICLIIVIVIELIWCYVKFGNYSYEFFEQKLVINRNNVRTIPYTELKHVFYSANFIDKWFKTGSMILELKDGKKVRLNYLDSPNQAHVLIQRYVK